MMRYFAEIDENNIVKRVIISESAELANALLGGTWVETFSNDVNKNYAGENYTYVPELQNFYSPKPNYDVILDAVDLKWKSNPDTFHVFYGPKPVTIITENNKVFNWNKLNKNWDEV